MDRGKLQSALGRMHFEKKLKVVYDIYYEEFALPFLAIQLLGENMLRQGLSKRGSRMLAMRDGQQGNDAVTVPIWRLPMYAREWKQ